MALDPSVFVHEKALCESDQIGSRTRIWAFAQVMRGAVIGEDCNVCGQSFIEGGARLGNRVTVKNGVQVWDGVTLEDDVFLGPNATLTNDLRPRVGFESELQETRVRRGASIGANATLVCGVTIGEYAFVGSGSVVTHDVASYALAFGNPARRRGWVCACGLGLDGDLACSCGRSFRLVDEAVGLAPVA